MGEVKNILIIIDACDGDQSIKLTKDYVNNDCIYMECKEDEEVFKLQLNRSEALMLIDQLKNIFTVS